MSFLWEGNNPLVFIIINCILGGGCAYLTGRAVAWSWRPFWHAVVYMLLLAAAVRFLRYALFQGTLLSLSHYLLAFIVLMIFCSLGFRITRTTQMVTQYRWLYERTSPFTWRERAPTTDADGGARAG